MQKARLRPKQNGQMGGQACAGLTVGAGKRRKREEYTVGKMCGLRGRSPGREEALQWQQAEVAAHLPPHPGEWCGAAEGKKEG